MALLPQMSSGAKVAIVTSRMGSLQTTQVVECMDTEYPKFLNMVGMSLAQDLREQGISVASSRIRQNGYDCGNGFIDADVSAKGLLQRIGVSV